MSRTIDEKATEILKILELDLKAFKSELNEVVKAIVEGGYSKYPVLIAHQDEIAVAQKVLDKEMFNSNFTFSASTLEELVAKKVVLQERKQTLEKEIESRSNECLILLLHKEVMRFIFTPIK